MTNAVYLCPLISKSYISSGHRRLNNYSIYYGVIFPKVPGCPVLSSRVHSCLHLGGPDEY